MKEHNLGQNRKAEQTAYQIKMMENKENLAIFLEIFFSLRCEMRAPSGISPISLYILAALKFTAGSLIESPLS